MNDAWTPLPPHDASDDCPYVKTDRGCYYCCSSCNYDRHTCHFCGDPLTHLNNLPDGSPNPCYADARGDA